MGPTCPTQWPMGIGSSLEAGDELVTADADVKAAVYQEDLSGASGYGGLILATSSDKSTTLRGKVHEDGTCIAKEAGICLASTLSLANRC